MRPKVNCLLIFLLPPTNQQIAPINKSTLQLLLIIARNTCKNSRTSMCCTSVYRNTRRNSKNVLIFLYYKTERVGTRKLARTPPCCIPMPSCSCSCVPPRSALPCSLPCHAVHGLESAHCCTFASMRVWKSGDGGFEGIRGASCCSAPPYVEVVADSAGHL